MEAAIMSTKRLTIGQPTELTIGPANRNPKPNSRIAPVKMEMIEKESAKLETPPISRSNCWAYPSLCKSRRSSRIISSRDLPVDSDIRLVSERNKPMSRKGKRDEPRGAQLRNVGIHIGKARHWACAVRPDLCYSCSRVLMSPTTTAPTGPHAVLTADAHARKRTRHGGSLRVYPEALHTQIGR